MHESSEDAVCELSSKTNQAVDDWLGEAGGSPMPHVRRAMTEARDYFAGES